MEEGVKLREDRHVVDRVWQRAESSPRDGWVNFGQCRNWELKVVACVKVKTSQWFPRNQSCFQDCLLGDLKAHNPKPLG